MTLAAHKWKGQRVCVKNNNNGKRITAKVNDCGPYERRGKRWVPHSVRSFDLSKGLMGALNGSGIIDVTVTPGPC